MLTSEQWLEIAERMDEEAKFICHVAQDLFGHEGEDAAWNELRALIPDMRFALSGFEPDDSGQMSLREYREAKVLLCCLIAQMSAEDRAELGTE